VQTSIDKSTNKEIAFSQDNPADWRDLYNAVLYDLWCYALSANVHQMLRHHLNDYHPDHEKDCYRPFMEAMCAYEESKFREAKVCQTCSLNKMNME